MPIFEYRCQACDTLFEELVFGHHPQVVCPECGHDEVKKLVSVVSFRTRGSSRAGEAYRPSSSSKCGGCSSHACTTCH